MPIRHTYIQVTDSFRAYVYGHVSAGDDIFAPKISKGTNSHYETPRPITILIVKTQIIRTGIIEVSRERFEK